jgi:hypothetical protein
MNISHRCKHAPGEFRYSIEGIEVAIAEAFWSEGKNTFEIAEALSRIRRHLPKVYESAIFNALRDHREKRRKMAA